MAFTLLRVSVGLALLVGLTAPARGNVPSGQEPQGSAAASQPQSAPAIIPPAQRRTAAPVAPPPFDSPAELQRIERQVNGAMVECLLPHSRSEGVLLGDRRTAIAFSVGLYSGRRVIVRPAPLLEDGQHDARARAASVRVERLGTDEDSWAYLVHLGSELPGTPLRVSSAVPRLGASVYIVRLADRLKKHRAAATTLAAVSADELDVAVPTGEVLFVLDREGDLLAVRAGSRLVLASQLLSSRAPPRRVSVLPVIGLRFARAWDEERGNELGFDAEAGLALWDRLSIVARAGMSFGEQSAQRLTTGGPGSGMVMASSTRAHVGMELRYRQLFADGVYTYLDLVAGVEGAFVRYHADGPALFSESAACDPFVSACPLRFQPPDVYLDQLGYNGVGFDFGADLRLGPLVIGYRFLPGALADRLANRHLFTIGLSGL